MKQMRMAIIMALALFAFPVNTTAQELPQDPRSETFLTCWNQVQEANPGMNFREMTTTTPFTYCDGSTEYLMVGDTRGPWGFVFRDIFGQDYDTYRSAHSEQFTNGTEPATQVTPVASTAAATNTPTWGWLGWILLAILAYLLIHMWITADRRLERIHLLENDKADLGDRAEKLRHNLNREESRRYDAEQRLSEAHLELEEHEMLHDFRMQKPLPIARDDDPIFGFSPLRREDEERSPTQVSNDLDYLVRSHLGPEYFVDHSTIETGIMNGPTAVNHYGPNDEVLTYVDAQGNTREHVSVRRFENVRGYHAKARKGRGENAEITDVYAAMRCFNLCGEAMEGFTFTPDSTLTNTELVERIAEGPSGLVPTQDPLMGAVVCDVERDEFEKVEAIRLRASDTREHYMELAPQSTSPR